MAALTKPMGAGLLMLMLLAECSSPPTGEVAQEAPANKQSVDVASAPASQAVPQSQEDAGNAQIDAATLPEDVRDFILKQRMCRHFSRPEAEGGNPAMAGVMCAGADEAAWKVLVRKYQDDDAIASVLLAERPPSSEPAQ